jgi:hypothetical protein
MAQIVGFGKSIGSAQRLSAVEVSAYVDAIDFNVLHAVVLRG